MGHPARPLPDRRHCAHLRPPPPEEEYIDPPVTPVCLPASRPEVTVRRVGTREGRDWMVSGGRGPTTTRSPVVASRCPAPTSTDTTGDSGGTRGPVHLTPRACHGKVGTWTGPFPPVPGMSRVVSGLEYDRGGGVYVNPPPSPTVLTSHPAPCDQTLPYQIQGPLPEVRHRRSTLLAQSAGRARNQ